MCEYECCMLICGWCFVQSALETEQFWSVRINRRKRNHASSKLRIPHYEISVSIRLTLPNTAHPPPVSSACRPCTHTTHITINGCDFIYLHSFNIRPEQLLRNNWLHGQIFSLNKQTGRCLCYFTFERLICVCRCHGIRAQLFGK